MAVTKKSAKAAAKKAKAVFAKMDRDWAFTKTIRGTVKAATLEEAEAKLDHGENTEALKRRGIVVEGRKVDVEESSNVVTAYYPETGWVVN